VDQHSRAFIGIDTSKLRNAVAVAEEGRGAEVRYLGEIDTTEAATRKLVTKLAAKYRQLTDVLLRGGTDRLRALSADHHHAQLSRYLRAAGSG
jgi:hypothetical protein